MSLTLSDSPAQWDLSSLFSGTDDPRIEKVWKDCLERSEAFASRWRGKLESGLLQASEVREAIAEVESIAQSAAKPMNFAELLFAANTGDPKLGAFLQAQRERATELNVRLMFFELELQKAPEEAAARWIEDPALADYRHYLQVVRRFCPHRLSEAEEVILEETANTGSRAWTRLFEEVTSNHHFRFFVPGKGEPSALSLEEVLDLLRDPDRATRQAAADALTEGLRELQRVTTFILNILLQDKSVDDRLRRHPFPEHARHLSNELDEETVNLVVSKAVERYPLVHRFYRVKAEILGLRKLTHIDRYAPLDEAQRTLTWPEAREIVLNAFGGFSGELRSLAGEFFEKGWIDAEPRPGKSGGAFCASITPDTHPVVLLTFLGKLDDAMVLAHELGHGVHGSLSRGQTYFNFHSTLPLAELASTFGEMLVFERLVADAGPEDRLALYAEKIESVFATVFRQAAMYRFEQRCHRERRESGELTAERLGEIWQEELQAMFGDALELGEQHKLWWSYVSHFFMAPFYVYAYAFGELLALSLYGMAKRQGAGFQEKYLKLLRMGGSRSPQELMAEVGVDLRDPGFWAGGLGAVENLVAEFEKLWSQVKQNRGPRAGSS